MIGPKAKSSHRKRARKQGASIGRIDYKYVFKRDRGYCYLCLQPIGKDELSFDHVQPLCRGGSHTEDNLRPTHRDCNTAKGTKTVIEFREAQRRGV